MSEERAALRIVHGVPTPEELAAVTAVMSAAASGESNELEPPLRGRWADPSALHRRPWPSGPGAWRSAFR